MTLGVLACRTSNNNRIKTSLLSCSHNENFQSKGTELDEFIKPYLKVLVQCFSNFETELYVRPSCCVAREVRSPQRTAARANLEISAIGRRNTRAPMTIAPMTITQAKNSPVTALTDDTSEKKAVTANDTTPRTIMKRNMFFQSVLICKQGTCRSAL